MSLEPRCPTFTSSSSDNNNNKSEDECGRRPRSAYVEYALRLTAPAGVRALDVKEGDVSVGGMLCCSDLHVKNAIWRDFEVTARPGTLERVGHARFRKTNGSITVDYDVDVRITAEEAQGGSVALSMPSLASAHPLHNRFATGIFSWIGENAVTIGRIVVRRGDIDGVMFNSPAFQAGTWHLCGSIDYEINS